MQFVQRLRNRYAQYGIAQVSIGVGFPLNLETGTELVDGLDAEYLFNSGVPKWASFARRSCSTIIVTSRYLFKDIQAEQSR
jgi:hypothetical protein